MLKIVPNECINTGIFPDPMRFAMITPIYKGGSRLKVSTYRPDSVLAILKKTNTKQYFNNSMVSRKTSQQH